MFCLRNVAYTTSLDGSVSMVLTAKLASLLHQKHKNVFLTKILYYPKTKF